MDYDENVIAMVTSAGDPAPERTPLDLAVFKRRAEECISDTAPESCNCTSCNMARDVLSMVTLSLAERAYRIAIENARE